MEGVKKRNGQSSVKKFSQHITAVQKDCVSCIKGLKMNLCI